MSEPHVLMHISDLHFHHLSLNPLRYFSKRALGGLNLFLRRRRLFPRERALRLVEALEQAEWSHLLITGDLTQLALEEEFALARRTLEPLLARGADRVTVIPGNHDRYVQEAVRRRWFEVYFGEYGPRNALLTRRLTDQWHLAAWDSAFPAPPWSAAGRVPLETLKETDAWLSTLPPGARVMVANHYAVFFPPPFHYKRGHDLTNQERVRAWLLERPVDLYLHGHVHHNWVMTVPRERGPLTVVNSASSTQRQRPGDPSAYHRIVLQGGSCQVQPMQLD